MRHYTHFSIEEREKLLYLKGQGKKLSEIARELGRSKSTISRELKRNKTSHRPYSPTAAQRRYEQKRKNCGRKAILEDPKAGAYVKRLIQEEHWSPEQIDKRLELEGNSFRISYATIYRAINCGLLEERPRKLWHLKKSERFSRFLRRKGKKYRKHGKDTKPGRYQIGNTIHERPKEAEGRSALGYWEADTVAGTKGSSRLVTLTDRKSRYLLAAKVPTATKEDVCGKMAELLGALPKGMVKGVTPDRGHEFADRSLVSQAVYNVKFYFADPYSPWQRGTNENTNGLMRECLPKYTDMTFVDDAVIDDFVYRLNRRPRKCLDWRSPAEIFFAFSLHLT